LQYVVGLGLIAIDNVMIRLKEQIRNLRMVLR
jgi:hypothetical protein